MVLHTVSWAWSLNLPLSLIEFVCLLQGGLDLKDNLPPGAGAWPYPSVYHPYDAAFAGYPFNG